VARNLNKTLQYKTSECFDGSGNVVIGNCDSDFVLKILNAQTRTEKDCFIASFVVSKRWDFDKMDQIDFFFDTLEEQVGGYFDDDLIYPVTTYRLKARKTS
jgi:hypothetical protein